jgi:hypothetical protein
MVDPDPINTFWKDLVDALQPGKIEIDVGSRWRDLIDSEPDCDTKGKKAGSHNWGCRIINDLQAPRLKFEPVGYTFEVIVRHWDILMHDAKEGYMRYLMARLSYDPRPISLFGDPIGSAPTGATTGRTL